MPELPEVETVVRTLRPLVVGRRILHARLARRDVVRPRDLDLAALLEGHAVASLNRRGKRILFQMDDGGRFWVHLGMSGRLTAHPHGEPSAPHTHLVLHMSGEPAVEIRFRDPRRFGEIRWLFGHETTDCGLGPEALGVRTVRLAACLVRTRRAIKTALLDQRLLAGLGNIYADEALFAAGIHPVTPANELNAGQVTALAEAIRTVLRRAVRHRGSTLRDYVDAEGRSGGFQKLHRVYGRENQPCPVCGSAIQRMVLAGRSTHFCPACQRAVSRS